MPAAGSIPKSKQRRNKKLVPWWTEECRQAVKKRNRAFKLVKNTHNMQHLIQYKKAQANVRNSTSSLKGKLEDILQCNRKINTWGRGLGNDKKDV